MLCKYNSKYRPYIVLLENMQHIQILKAIAAKHAGRAALMSVCPIDLAIYLLACIKIILCFVCISYGSCRIIKQTFGMKYRILEKSKMHPNSSLLKLQRVSIYGGFRFDRFALNRVTVTLFCS